MKRGLRSHAEKNEKEKESEDVVMGFRTFKMLVRQKPSQLPALANFQVDTDPKTVFERKASQLAKSSIITESPIEKIAKKKDPGDHVEARRLRNRVVG